MFSLLVNNFGVVGSLMQEVVIMLHNQPNCVRGEKEKDMSLRADYIVPKGSNLLYGDFNHITGVHAANS